MRAAIIGLGVIGNVHSKVLREMDALYAVCDIDESKFEGFSDVKCETDYLRMMDELKPDVVHICTPHYLHADMVIAALERNINVLCEKPLCIHAEDIDRILEAERKSTAQLGVCTQNRFNPANLFVKDYIKDKELICGSAQVAWCRDAAYYASGEWRGKWATEGGGILINQALHTVDLMEWFLGEPTKLVASISNLTLQKEIEVEDTATIICSEGADFTFFATNGSVKSMQVEITLRTKTETIKIFPHTVLINEQVYSFDSKIEHKYGGKVCYGNGHAALIADFYDCITTGRPFSINATEAAKATRLILAAYRSNGVKIDI